jgi:hypothetical protein
MTPATFKKYKELAQDLETRTPLPVAQINRGLHHLEDAYKKTIRGVVSKIADRSHQYKVELRYEPKEVLLGAPDGIESTHGGHWVCSLKREVYSSYTTMWKGKEMSDMKSAEIREWFTFTTTEELLKRTENCVKFLEGFKLQHDSKTVLEEDWK